MCNAILIAALAVAAASQTSEAERYGSQVVDPVIEGRCNVADYVKLPAEEAGVLVHLSVEEGSQVSAGQKIGQIDDSEALLQKKAAEFGATSALKKAQDDVEIRFQKASADTYEAEYRKLLETNQSVDRAVTESDIRLAKLKWDQAVLGTEKTTHDREIAKYDYYAKKAEVEAADLAIQQRILKAPFDGVVEELFRRQGEWVNPGDPILYLLRLDTMEVEAGVDPAQYDPHELQGCDVTVEVQLARGRKENVRGRITMVSAMIGLQNKFRVRAEVPNRQEHGSWLLRGGMRARMTIHLGTGGQAGSAVSQAP
jgi:HlyD family secretion protein